MEKENQEEKKASEQPEEKKATEQIEELKLEEKSVEPQISASLMLKEAFESLGIDSGSPDFNEEEALAKVTLASR